MISELTDILHEMLAFILGSFYPNLTDKDFHFIVIGIIGIFIFIYANIIFKFLAKFSIEIISFIFTFFVILVIVFAIEIQQFITGNGNMEFNDIAYGIYGFLFSIIIYIMIKSLINYGKKTIYKYRDNKS